MLLIAGLSLVVLWLLAVLVLLWLGRKTLARELITLLPNLVRLFRGLLGDDRVPRASKALLLFGVLWLASPIDLIPEFLPGIGPIDDAVVAFLVLRSVVKRAGPDIVREHWRGDPRTLGVLLRVAGISSTERSSRRLVGS
jgi:uncharacterized membrane protein YkvA (DUF1232 family)